MSSTLAPWCCSDTGQHHLPSFCRTTCRIRSCAFVVCSHVAILVFGLSARRTCGMAVCCKPSDGPGRGSRYCAAWPPAYIHPHSWTVMLTIPTDRVMGCNPSIKGRHRSKLGATTLLAKMDTLLFTGGRCLGCMAKGTRGHFGITVLMQIDVGLPTTAGRVCVGPDFRRWIQRGIGCELQSTAEGDLPGVAEILQDTTAKVGHIVLQNNIRNGCQSGSRWAVSRRTTRN